MPFGRRKSSEATSSSEPSKGLRRKTMPTRFAEGDKRAPKDGPIYQSSRGGWFKEPVKPIPGTPKE